MSNLVVKDELVVIAEAKVELLHLENKRLKHENVKMRAVLGELLKLATTDGFKKTLEDALKSSE